MTIYGLTLLFSVILLFLLWRYAVLAHLVWSDTADDELVSLTKRLAPGLLAYVVIIVLGLFLPVIAVIGYLLIALFFIIPLRSARRRRPARR